MHLVNLLQFNKLSLDDGCEYLGRYIIKIGMGVEKDDDSTD
jgi:hypothetical protein